MTTETTTSYTGMTINPITVMMSKGGWARPATPSPLAERAPGARVRGPVFTTGPRGVQ